MSHLRLVHSTSRSSASTHPCVEAFQRELDYVHETLRRLGAKDDEIEDLAHKVFLTLYRSWPTDDPSRPPARPLRPHLFSIAFRTLCATRASREPEIPRLAVDTLDDSGEITPTSHFMSVLLDAGRIVPTQPDAIRERAVVRAAAALSNRPAVAPAPDLRERERGPGFRIVVPLILAFAIGATGVALALHDRRDPLPPVSARPAVPASESSVRRAHREPAPTVAPAPPSPGKRLRSHRLPAADKPVPGAELECLQRALTSFVGHDFDGALATLMEHARRFPRGWLAEEREALRVRSLAGAGRTDEARAAAAEFGARFPHSVLGQSLTGPNEAGD